MATKIKKQPDNFWAIFFQFHGVETSVRNKENSPPALLSVG